MFFLHLGRNKEKYIHEQDPRQKIHHYGQAKYIELGVAAMMLPVRVSERVGKAVPIGVSNTGVHGEAPRSSEAGVPGRFSPFSATVIVSRVDENVRSREPGGWNASFPCGALPAGFSGGPSAWAHRLCKETRKPRTERDLRHDYVARSRYKEQDGCFSLHS